MVYQRSQTYAPPVSSLNALTPRPTPKLTARLLLAGEILWGLWPRILGPCPHAPRAHPWALAARGSLVRLVSIALVFKSSIRALPTLPSPSLLSPSAPVLASLLRAGNGGGIRAADLVSLTSNVGALSTHSPACVHAADAAFGRRCFCCRKNAPLASLAAGQLLSSKVFPVPFKTACPTGGASVSCNTHHAVISRITSTISRVALASRSGCPPPVGRG